MPKIIEIARLGVDEQGKYTLRLYDTPLKIVKQGIINALESVIEMEIKIKLESKIVKIDGTPQIKTDMKGA